MVLKEPIESPLLFPVGAEATSAVTVEALAEGDEEVVNEEDKAAADTAVVVAEEDEDGEGEDECLGDEDGRLIVVAVLGRGALNGLAPSDLVGR